MKVLLINKFHYLRGGSETYYFAQAKALREKGHEVVFFAMQDEKNLPCEQADYFVPNVDYNRAGGIMSKLRAAKDFCYSKEAAAQMERLISDEHPDVAHVGLLHRQITFSVIEVLKRHHIPVVMTMHDLIFTCPNYTMLTGGAVCEDCMGTRVMPCIRKKCVKQSFSKSALAAYEKKYLLRHRAYDMIDLYITECDLYRRLMLKSRVTTSEIKHRTNFLPVEQEYHFSAAYQDYVLYFGRFEREKGVMTLLKAHEASGCRHRLIMVGKGELDEEVHAYVRTHGLTNIELPGAIYGEEMDAIIEGARVIIVPSEWYENCPYALLQAIARGKIVIASDIGGLPELIVDGKTGFLFQPGDVQDLNRKIDAVFAMDKEQYEAMSVRTSEEAKKHHAWEPYIDWLIGEYTRLIAA